MASRKDDSCSSMQHSDILLLLLLLLCAHVMREYSVAAWHVSTTSSSSL
jgi:hypothetical protein